MGATPGAQLISNSLFLPNLWEVSGKLSRGGFLPGEKYGTAVSFSVCRTYVTQPSLLPVLPLLSGGQAECSHAFESA